MEINITPEELLAEQFKQLDIKPRPKEEDGWFSMSYIMERAPEGVTKNMLRDTYEKGVEKGIIEKTKWGVDVYYRTLAPAEVQQETDEE